MKFFNLNRDIFNLELSISAMANKLEHLAKDFCITGCLYKATGIPSMQPHLKNDKTL